MIIVQVPLRISFFGGGTDFPEYYEKYGGAVLTTAINKYIYVIVKPRFDDKIRLTYTKTELVSHSKDLKHDIVRACMKETKIDHGIEIVTIGDVPSGTGLGSSSAVTVGVLKALHAYNGYETGQQEIADLADEIDRITLKQPIGVQDQYICSFGGFRFFGFDYEGITQYQIPVNQLFDNLLVFYTGISRNSSKILKVQRKNISKRIEILNKMKGLVPKAIESISTNNFDEFGKLLNEEWELKKQLGPISTPHIDSLYKKAIKAGALGGKLLGAGGGGFLLFYCPGGTKENVRKSLSKLVEMQFKPEPDGAKVILNYRT